MIKKQMSLIILITCSFLQASQNMVKLNGNAHFASHKLGKIEIYHDDERFHVMQNNILHPVEDHCIEKTLRNIDTKKLSTFLNSGHLAINKKDNGEFTIRAHGHLKGGGPITGCAVYTATKASLIGALVTGTAAAVCVTGGAAVGAAGAIAAGTATAAGTAGGMAAAAAGSVVTSATLGTGAGAALAAGSVVLGATETVGATALLASAAAGSTALAASGGTIAATGGIVGATAAIGVGIEAAAVAAAAPFFACPWLP